MLTGVYSEETHLPQPLRISLDVELRCPEHFAPDTPLSASKSYLDLKHAATDRAADRRALHADRGRGRSYRRDAVPAGSRASRRVADADHQAGDRRGGRIDRHDDGAAPAVTCGRSRSSPGDAAGWARISRRGWREAGYDLALHSLGDPAEADGWVTARSRRRVPTRRCSPPIWPMADAVAALLAAVEAHFGRPVDLLVNSASRFAAIGRRRRRRCEELIDASGRQPRRPRCAGAVAIARGAGGAAVVNILDQRIAHPPRRPARLYAVEAGAGGGDADAGASRLRPDVRVNGVAPGLVAADRGLCGRADRRVGAMMPLGRNATRRPRSPTPSLAGAGALGHRARSIFVDGGAHLEELRARLRPPGALTAGSGRAPARAARTIVLARDGGIGRLHRRDRPIGQRRAAGRRPGDTTARYRAPAGAAASSTISLSATAQRGCSPGRRRIDSETGRPSAVFRKICVSPSPGSDPATWKALPSPVIAGGASGATTSRAIDAGQRVELGRPGSLPVERGQLNLARRDRRPAARTAARAPS